MSNVKTENSKFGFGKAKVKNGARQKRAREAM